MKLSGNTILITGGGSGIGRALAENFYSRGNVVIIAGRREAMLQETISHSPGMRAITLDTSDVASIEQMTTILAREHPELNVLINNAGIMPKENLDSKISAGAATIVSTNLLGPIRLTEALIPLLKRQQSSTVLNVSSGAAFVPMARFPTYSASKAALHSYTESLRHNLQGTSVKVIEIVPPYVRTELTGPSQAKDLNAMPVTEFVEEIFNILEQEPDCAEIVVERLKFARFAEAAGNYSEVFKNFNAWVDQNF